MEIASVGSPALWVGFFVFIGLALAINLGVVHRRAHAIGTREAAIATVIWISIALLFNLWVFFEFGAEPALEFLAAYVIEKALSVDNIFVFIMLFSYFAVPAKLQHRVLFFGILGAVVFRGVFIVAGTILIQKFHWIMYILGMLLVYTGYKLLRDQDIELEPESNPVVKFVRKIMPVSDQYQDDHFFVKQAGRWVATPLFIVLMAVETTDVVFAVDSIPAVFAITQDPFLVFSSNIFAILGLRALYFLLASAMRKFAYLQIGLAFVLSFIGVKMLVSGWFKIPIWISLAVIMGMLTIAVLASLRRGLIETPIEPPPK